MHPSKEISLRFEERKGIQVYLEMRCKLSKGKGSTIDHIGSSQIKEGNEGKLPYTPSRLPR